MRTRLLLLFAVPSLALVLTLAHGRSAQQVWRFGPVADRDAWRATDASTAVEWSDGVVRLRGRDPRLVLDGPVDARGVRWIRLRLRLRLDAESAAPLDAATFERRHPWLTIGWLAEHADHGLPRDAAAYADVTPDGEMRTVHVPVGANSQWNGTVSRLTVAALDDYSPAGAVELEELALLRYRVSPLGSWPAVLALGGAWLGLAALAADRQRGWRRRSSLGLLALLAPLTLLAAAELALNVAGFEDFGDPLVRVTLDELEAPGHRELFEYDRDLVFRNRPGAEYRRGERINTRGFRGAEVSPRRPTGALRVACLGDSTTFGLGVAAAESYPAQLERALEAALPGRDVETLNAGTIAYTAVQGYALLEKSVLPLEPQVVVLAYGVYNEHYLVPLSDRERMRLAGRLPAWLLSTRSVVGDHVKSFRLASRMLTSGLQALPRELEPRVGPDEFEATLERFVRRLREAGVGVVLLSMPRRAEVERETPAVLEYTGRMQAVAARHGVVLVDARGAFRSLGDDEARRFIDSVHLDAQANQVVADLLAPHVLAAASELP